MLKDGAISQNTRQRNGGKDTYMGYTIRTENYRYTEWALFNSGYPDWGSVGTDDVELYDVTSDPRENYNVAGQR